MFLDMAAQPGQTRRLSATDAERLLATLRVRFEKNIPRHQGLYWDDVQSRLDGEPGKLWSIGQMELTGGEPDVTGFDAKTGEFIFCDCSAETPNGRRNVCYDRTGQAEREKQGIHPSGNAVDLATEMGIEILTEELYHALQTIGSFDAKTSSWLKTPEDVRKLGGAVFGDRRFGRVFVYHNGAGSFYAARGFRGIIRV